MSPPRTPVVLGAGPGVGASTVAAALHAHDGGRRDIAADVVVCAGAEESLRRAEMLAVGGARPLLAVVLLHAGPAPAPPRLRLAGRRYAGVTVLPHVAAWSGRGGPAAGVAVLLGEHPDRLPTAHRAYADALRTVAAALLGSGLLDRPRPPVVAIPEPRRALPAAVPLPRPAPPPGGGPPLSRIVLPLPPPRAAAARTDLDDLDDEALEHAVALLGTR